MTSGEFEFKAVLAVAFGHITKDISKTQKTFIQSRLDRRILRCRIASLTIGLDTAGMQTVRQHDSLNHSIFYVEFENDGSTRFSMENSATSRKDNIAGRAYDEVPRPQGLKGSSWKEIMSLPRPWLSEDILTLRHLMIFVKIATINQFIMSEDLVGCRNWVKGFAQIIIEGLCFDLNMAQHRVHMESHHN